MATLTFEPPRRFLFKCSFAERHLAKDAGFQWDNERKHWFTRVHGRAQDLEAYADDRAKAAFYAASQRVAASRAVNADVAIPCPDGLEYLPYQKAGIVFALKTFNHKEAAHSRRGVLIADEMGL